jgi:hypothetical protein
MDEAYGIFTIPEDFLPPIASAHQIIDGTLIWVRSRRTIVGVKSSPAASIPPVKFLRQAECPPAPQPRWLCSDLSVRLR